MKALTLMQPWASLIAVGAKKIETRPWHPQENPGVIAIASSKSKMTKRNEGLCHTGPFAAALPDDAFPLPRGSIIAVGRLVDFRRTHEVETEDLTHEQHFGDFREGRWAWYFDNVVRLDEPIRLPAVKPGEKQPFRLNLWEVPKVLVTPELTAAVRKVEG